MGGGLSRRRFLGSGSTGLLLSGCGFRPLYGPAEDGSDGPAARGLSEISVALIPERSGQLLRQALQARFYGSGASRARLFELRTSFAVSSEVLAIHHDNSATRARLVGVASWNLAASDPHLGTIASGVARVVDGYNVFDQQYFAADLSSEAVQRRIAEAVADKITLQIATHFKKSPVFTKSPVG